jgi:ATP-dependent Clp protease ATP-binding subunit ClpA
MERLQEVLARTPESTPGRADLAAVVEAMQNLRRLLDEARLRTRAYRAADQALARARQAAEDRTGPELQEARRRLNTASREADAAGTAADQAWEAWQRGVVALLQRGS